MRARSLLLLSALAVTTVAPPARAQSDAAKLEQATKLYEEATKLLDDKRYDEACPKLEQAVQLVPVASGAQLALGACYEGKGKLASALRRYEEAAALAKAAGQAEREQRARESAAAVSPRVARLTIRPKGEAAAASGLVVKLDGAVIAKDALATPQPVDAGDHPLHAEAPGFAPLDEKLTIADGENRNFELALSKPGEAPPAPPPPASEPPREEGGGMSPLRVTGLVLGGVGVAGLAVGAVTGILALGKKSDGDEGCSKNDPNLCPADAVSAREDGFTFATVSTIGFIAGGALAAGGVVLFVVGGEDEGSGTSAARLSTELRPNGVAISGVF